MDRIPITPVRLGRRLAKRVLTAILGAALCLPVQAAFPTAALAAVTGTTSPSISIFYGTGEKVLGEWKEDTLTIDGKPAYCVEVDAHFEAGMQAKPCDPVATGIWSQEICTKLALIDGFVRSGSYVSTKKGTGDGHRVTKEHEQYAVAQCYIWKFLNDYGYAQNHYGWFGAATEDGVDLTGSDTDAQIWDYVRKNIGSYEGSAKYYDCGNSQDLACSFALKPVNGTITLSKRSANEELSQSSPSYSLAGAEYGIFGKEDCSQESLAGTLVTDTQGEARSSTLPAGTYYVKEMTPSPGFATDPASYKVDVAPGSESAVNAEAGCVFEQPVTGGVSLQKKSARPGLSEGNASYTLEGALYGIYADEACSRLIAKAETDKEGFFQAEGLPIGPCYIREISAPAGFATDATAYQAVVEEGKVSPVNGGRVEDLPKCTIPKIIAKKHDAQIGSESSSSQTGSGLAGAEFQVRFYAGAFENAEDAIASGAPMRTWVFESAEDGTVPFDEAHLVSGDALFLSSDGTPCIPLGTLVVNESAPPRGYTASNQTHCIRVADDGSAGEVVAEFEPAVFGNQVKRGDLEFVKVSGSEDNALEGVAFAITNQATGEKHVIVTGKDGRVSTSSDEIRHSRNTNGNDWMLETDGKPETPAPDENQEPSAPEEGSRPGTEGQNPGGQEGSEVPPVTAPPIDDDDSTDTQDLPGSIEKPEKPAAPRASENEGGTAEDNGNANGTGTPPAEPEAKPTGIWFGWAGEGNPPVKPDDNLGALPFGTYLIEELPCAANEGLQLVSASAVVGEHGQVVNLGFVDDPKATIATCATDGADGDKTLAASGRATVTDTVSYANLIPGRTYKLSGKLIDAETGDVATDSQGNGITAEAEFVPESENGTAEAKFEFPAEGLEGKRLTAFETLSCNGRVLALHEDPEDTDQTVSFAAPSIGTQAKGAGSGQTAAIGGTAAIVDTVSYTSLEPGREYALKGRLVNAETGETLVSNGQEASASCTFTPESSSGNIDVTFEFETAGLEPGTKLVAFQQLFDQDRLVAAHEDKNAPGQTVELVAPSIQTNLAERDSGSKTVSAGSPIALSDSVSYSNLVPGREYVLQGRLVDGESGETAVDAHGNPIETQHAFVPESPQGTTRVDFGFEGANLNGRTLTAFQSLSLDGREIASHADAESRAQSIDVTTPKIQTYASDAADQDQIVSGESQAEIRDEVSITGAAPGRSYTVMGILMDKATGLPLVQKAHEDEADAPSAEKTARFWKEFSEAAGLMQTGASSGETLALNTDAKADPAALEKLFAENPEIGNAIAIGTLEATPDSPSFTADMGFKISTQGLSGQTVVFEGLYDNEAGRFVAIHSDLGDKAQTVGIETPKKEHPPSESKAPMGAMGKAYDKTGNLIARYVWAIALLAALGCAFGAVAVSRRRSLKKRKGSRW